MTIYLVHALMFLIDFAPESEADEARGRPCQGRVEGVASMGGRQPDREPARAWQDDIEFALDALQKFMRSFPPVWLV